MTERDASTQQDPDAQFITSRGRGTDDRRGEVKPSDGPVPVSPDPEPDAVREGQEKLERVKPY